MDAILPSNAPFPPPGGAAVSTPIIPPARPHPLPELAERPEIAPKAAVAQTHGTSTRRRRPRSRSRVYVISTIVFLAISAAGYVGFRAYIYGDDAPPIPVLDDLGL